MLEVENGGAHKIHTEETVLSEALSNAHRLAIVKLLLKKPMIVGDLIKAYKVLGDTSMSRELKMLRQAGAVSFIQVGKSKRYSIVPSKRRYIKENIKAGKGFADE